MLRPYRAYNPVIEFSKYDINNKLLGSVTFFRVMSGVTWTQPCISEFDVSFGKSIVRLYYLHIFFLVTKFQGDQRLITMSSINCLDLSISSLK